MIGCGLSKKITYLTLFARGILKGVKHEMCHARNTAWKLNTRSCTLCPLSSWSSQKSLGALVVVEVRVQAEPLRRQSTTPHCGLAARSFSVGEAGCLAVLALPLPLPLARHPLGGATGGKDPGGSCPEGPTNALASAQGACLMQKPGATRK